MFVNAYDGRWRRPDRVRRTGIADVFRSRCPVNASLPAAGALTPQLSGPPLAQRRERARMHKRLFRRALSVTAVAAVVGALALAVVTPASAATFNVMDFGATGDGSTNDTPAINAAINAANGAGGGVVEFPAGSYKSKNSIHMKSNVTLQLDAGSTILGSSADTYDPAEPNPNDSFQDYGHSHFHDAMIWGDNLTNIGFTGSGTIDGAGNLITGNPGAGEADKIISLTRCDGLTLSGITLRRGGHFAALTNGCNHITSDDLNIQTASDRDGWNIISAQVVTTNNIHFSLGSEVPFRNNDNRPAVIANTGSFLSWDSFVAERGSGSAYDVGFQTINGYCVSNSRNTTGGALRINTSSSSQRCSSTTIQAETAILHGSAAVASCSTCSGGAKVRFIGGSSHNYATFTVDANAGANTVRFFNNTANAPDLDYITLA